MHLPQRGAATARVKRKFTFEDWSLTVAPAKEKKSKYTFIDLFAGAGGLSEGFVRAGFSPIAHIEMVKEACNTLKTRAVFHYLKENKKLDIYTKYLKEKLPKEDGSKLWNQVPKSVTQSVIQAEIGKKTIQNIFDKIDEIKKNQEVDLIIGGPPCQAYSSAGRARMGKAVEQDPRNELYKYYVRFLEKYKPKMFVFENVLGIKTAKGGAPFRDLQKIVRELDYEIEPREQLASDYGVLQNRHRMIIIGWRKNIKGIPTKYGYPNLIKEQGPTNILKELFSDLPERKAGEGSLNECVKYTKPTSQMHYLKKYDLRSSIGFTTQHVARPTNENDRQIYLRALQFWSKFHKQISYKDLPINLQKHKNKETFLNRFSVVSPDSYCHTVVAHIAMDGHYYIYPTENPTLQNVRSITVREAARLQSFPDDYFFEGSRSAALKQIGNAVPVLLAESVAKAIKKELKK